MNKLNTSTKKSKEEQLSSFTPPAPTNKVSLENISTNTMILKDIKPTQKKSRNKLLLLKHISLCIIALILLFSALNYSVAVWYQHSQKGKPYQVGVTFVPSYATYLGVDPKETLNAIINDLGVRQFRLVSYWNETETSPGVYDFSQLDWQFKTIEKVKGSISLSIGLRQPRWPECHVPSFYDTSQPRQQWQPALEHYMAAVIERYKSSPALSNYQLENESLLKSFGECKNFDRERFIEEYAFIKKLDNTHPIIMTRSNNYSGIALGKPRPDIVGISLYRRAWNTLGPQMYFTYPFPNWHFAANAGWQQLLTGRPSILHEVQAEPWPPSGQHILSISIEEQNITFDAKQFKSNVQFAKQTGIRYIDLWGAEYWYYRWKVLNDPSVWQEARHTFLAQK